MQDEENVYPEDFVDDEINDPLEFIEDDDDVITPCEHKCSGNCRKNGCNCKCGEFHCDKCGGFGYTEKTEWSEVDGKDMSYEIRITCPCRE